MKYAIPDLLWSREIHVKYTTSRWDDTSCSKKKKFRDSEGDLEDFFGKLVADDTSILPDEPFFSVHHMNLATPGEI